MKIKSQSGQTLLEALIALGVGVAILSSIVVVVFVSLAASVHTKNQTLATQNGQTAMEQVRKLRDTGWSQFAIYDGTYCLAQDGNLTKLTGPSCSKIAGFSRTVDFVWDQSRQRATVTVAVAWTDGKGTHQSKLVSYFTQYATP